MPLRDHFAPPLSRLRHWGAFHATWAAKIAMSLNQGVLPPNYVAEPLVDWAGPIEIDVATQETAAREEGGGTALATYAPPSATRSIAVDWAREEVVEIQVHRDEGGLRLIAAIELVSPGNKDRPANRQAFVDKCRGYLKAGVSVVIVDVVTSRGGNLSAELMRSLGDDSADGDRNIYLASSRFVGAGESGSVECWESSLEVGEPIPVVPMWLAVDLAAPLELEESYEATCEGLRIE